MEIDYFILQPSYDVTIVGNYPQAVCSDRDDNFVYLNLENRAILTDVLSVINCDQSEEIVVSRKFLEALKPFISPNIIIRPVKFYNLEVKHLYYSVLFNAGVEKHINFENSIFQVFKTSDDLGEIKINSYEDFLEKKKLVNMGSNGYPFLSVINCTKMTVKSSFAFNGITKVVSNTNTFFKDRGLLINSELQFVLSGMSGVNLIPIEFYQE
ncbi:MAG TPA: hypothetical protein PLW44_03580 [Chitinophagales bacterium]|nr:hypothetical protein [Chitinophagales bacterium]